MLRYFILTLIICKICKAKPQDSLFSIKLNGWGNMDQNEDNAMTEQDDSHEPVWGIFGLNTNHIEDNGYLNANTENIRNEEHDINPDTISNSLDIPFVNSNHVAIDNNHSNQVSVNEADIEDTEEVTSDDDMPVARRAHYTFQRLCRTGCLVKKLCSNGSFESTCIKNRYRYLSSRTILRYKNTTLC